MPVPPGLTAVTVLLEEDTIKPAHRILQAHTTRNSPASSGQRSQVNQAGDPDRQIRSLSSSRRVSSASIQAETTPKMRPLQLVHPALAILAENAGPD